MASDTRRLRIRRNPSKDEDTESMKRLFSLDAQEKNHLQTVNSFKEFA